MSAPKESAGAPDEGFDPPSWSLAGRTIVVTGGNGAIGSEIADRLAALGANVAVYDVAPDGPESSGRARGPMLRRQVVDVTDAAAVALAVHQTSGRWGRIHGLVNCVGAAARGEGSGSSTLDVTVAEFRQLLEANLVSAYLCSQRVIPSMIASGGGTIVNVSSMVASTFPQGQSSAAYAASKAGLEGLTRAMAVEHAADGIRVNGVAPGRVSSPMARRVSPEVWDRAVAEIPLGRAAEPAEVARPVAFLLSDQSSYLTGAVLDVSGGRAIV